MAKSEASVSMITGLWASKWASIGAEVNLCFSSLNAVSASLVHVHFSVFFVNSVRGRVILE